MPSILKKRDDFRPLPTYKSNTELFEAAAAAFASMAGILELNGAPSSRIEPSAFEDNPPGSFAQAIETYKRVCFHKSNSKAIIMSMPALFSGTTTGETDPLFWANNILMHSLSVNAKKQTADKEKHWAARIGEYNKKKREACSSSSSGDEEEEDQDMTTNHKRARLLGLDSERVFTASEPKYDESVENFYPTHDFDGPSPVSMALHTLLVEKKSRNEYTIRHSSASKTGISRFFRTDPTIHRVKETLAALRLVVVQLKLGKEVKLYPTLTVIPPSSLFSLSCFDELLVQSIADLAAAAAAPVVVVASSSSATKP
jgi:hypothetical protein